MAEIRTDLSNAAYHASPGLSASGAKMLLPPSCPAIYKHRRENPEYKDVYDFGSAAHKLVLNDEDAVIVEVEADSWRSKGAQATKAEARESGRIPMLTKDLTVARAMAAKLREHPVASKLFQPGSGQPELSIFWDDVPTGVARRARLDWMPESDGGRLILADYKTAISAEPGKFSRSLWDYGYTMQAPWYVDAAQAAGVAEDIAFVFVVQSKEPPYLVTVVQPDIDAMRIGDERNRLAIDTYKRCTETGVWPGYAEDVALVSLPRWAEYEHEDLMEKKESA